MKNLIKILSMITFLSATLTVASIAYEGMVLAATALMIVFAVINGKTKLKIKLIK